MIDISIIIPNKDTAREFLIGLLINDRDNINAALSADIPNIEKTTPEDTGTNTIEDHVNTLIEQHLNSLIQYYRGLQEVSALNIQHHDRPDIKSIFAKDFEETSLEDANNSYKGYGETLKMITHAATLLDIGYDTSLLLDYN